MKLFVFAILIFLSSLSANGQSGIRINVETQVVCEGQVQLVVSGDFVNNGTFTPSNGTIYLKGSSKQNIGGSGNNTFYGIELDNASGADLSSDIAVTNELNLNNGILDLVNSNLTMGTGACGAWCSIGVEYGRYFGHRRASENDFQEHQSVMIRTRSHFRWAAMVLPLSIHR